MNNKQMSKKELDIRLKLLKLMPLNDTSQCRCGNRPPEKNGVYDCYYCNTYYTTQKQIDYYQEQLKRKA